MLEVRLFGQFEARQDGAAVVIPSRAAQSLLAYLLLTAGTVHRREKLAGLLWPDTTEENARKNLRNELWRLRKAIETKTPRKKAIPYLLVDEISIGFNVESDYWLDVSIVRSTLAEQVSANHLIETLSLYRGELLPGFYDEWVVLERERVRAVFEQMMARLLESLIEEKRWQDILEWGERWIALGQTPEPAYRALMVAHSALGNVSQVASVYERCAQAMRNDLGVEPSEQTRALFERLSKGDRISEVSQSPKADPPIQETITPPEARREAISALSQTSLPRPRNLPIPLTSFIGRQREIEEVKHLLSSTRLMTLTGAGGVGKTRLAIQVATDLVDAFEDGVWWVELAALNDSAFVAQTVAETLHVREVLNQLLIETLMNFLDSRKLLLVLDNCEHLIAVCAQLVEQLLAVCPTLKILTTSREALGIGGEIVWLVPTLSLPDPKQSSQRELLLQFEGTRLFVERAAAVRQDFAITPPNASSVAEICRRLDGIPLAIELAAARVKTLSVEEVAARLDDRFNLLTVGSRTALPRHQTLYAAIDWSYDLLTEKEKILFHRLAVFAGGFTLEAAKTVCGGAGIHPEHVLDALSRLVDKSLVIVRSPGSRGETRYHVLETIRQYAWDHLLESDEADDLRTRHLEYFLKLAEDTEPKLKEAEQKSWSDRLDEEYDNLRTALAYCNTVKAHSESGLRLAGSLWRFWHNRGRLSEGRKHLRDVLEPTAARMPAQTAARAKALNASGTLAFYQGDFASARSLLEEGLEIYRKLSDRRGIANALNSLGNVALSQGDYITSRLTYEESLAIRGELGDRWGIARLLSNLGLIARSLGELARARSLQEESLVLFRELGDKNGVAYALNALGEIERDQGNLQTAQSFQNESERIYRELGNKWGLAYALDSLGDVAMSKGDYCVAHKLYRESLELFREEAELWGIAYSLESFAAIAGTQGQPVRAARLFGAAETLREVTGLPLPPVDRAEYARNVAALDTLIGAAPLAAAWAEGRAMTIEQAVAYALEDKSSD